MVYYLILCRSLTYAQRTARILERSGINCHIMRTPKKIAVEGCGYCVKIAENRIARALTLLKQNELPPKQIYIHSKNDAFDEVEL